MVVIGKPHDQSRRLYFRYSLDSCWFFVNILALGGTDGCSDEQLQLIAIEVADSEQLHRFVMGFGRYSTAKKPRTTEHLILGKVGESDPNLS